MENTAQIELPTSASAMMDIKPEPRTAKHRYENDLTSETEQLPGSSSMEAKLPEEVCERLKSLYSETIRQWWVGRVLEIHGDEGYFVAALKDLEGLQSIAEFDIGPLFEDDMDVKQYLFEGAEFAFFVFTRHRGRGSPETVSRVEFSSPYVWREEDSKKADKLYSELFHCETRP